MFVSDQLLSAIFFGGRHIILAKFVCFNFLTSEMEMIVLPGSQDDWLSDLNCMAN